MNEIAKNKKYKNKTEVRHHNITWFYWLKKSSNYNINKDSYPSI